MSLGTFCIAATLARRAGADQPTYPFDDIFCSMSITNDCLEDRFADFLDYDNYLPSINDGSWIRRVYAERYAFESTFAHHDMRIDANREKFRRRVDRFLQLSSQDNPLFLVIDYVDRTHADGYVRLQRNLAALFGTSNVLVILLGSPRDNDQRIFADVPGLTVRYYCPNGAVLGTLFELEADNDAVVAQIRDVWMRPVDIGAVTAG